MKNLDKPVRRRTITAYGLSSGRRLVVILEPGDILAMREERRRTVYRGSLAKIFWVLAKWDAADRKHKKDLERALKRRGGP